MIAHGAIEYNEEYLDSDLIGVKKRRSVALYWLATVSKVSKPADGISSNIKRAFPTWVALLVRVSVIDLAPDADPSILA